MPTIGFKGEILPPHLKISVGTIHAHWDIAEHGLIADFDVTIDKGQIDIQCAVNRYQENEMIHLWMRALDLARGAANLIGFAMGNGLTVRLETIVRPDGTQASFNPFDPALAALCTAFKINTQVPAENAEFYEVLGTVLGSVPLFMALDDLMTSITLPHHSVTNCARAVETLRHLVAPGVPRKQGWEVLRTNLQISQDYLEFVTSYSVAGRHGERSVHIPGNITTELAHRGWIIMNRYLEFTKRGRLPLPTAEFPLL